MRFVNVKWTPPENWRPPSGWRPNGLVYDEQLLGTATEPWTGFETDRLSTKHVASIYKGLRQSYESTLHYAEAGPFHIREMEMRRLGNGESAVRRAGSAGRFGKPIWRAWAGLRRNLTPLNAYRLTSSYGESYARAFWSILIWFLAVASFERWLRPRWFPQPLGWPHKLVNQAIGLMPAQVAGDSVTDFVGRLVGVFLIAGFIIALRRHFRR